MRAPRWFFSTLAFVLSLSLSFSAVHGQDRKAAAADLFRKAAEAYARGDYASAASSFEESHGLIPRAAAIYNAALAREALGQKERAADDYETALEKTDLRGAQAVEARKRLDRLRREVGVLEVSAPSAARVTVGHAKAAAPPVRIHLAPGTYDVEVEHGNGARAVKRATVSVGAPAQLSFEAPPAVAPPASAAPVAPRPPPPPPRPDRAEGGSIRATLGWISLGGSVAFAGAAVGLGVATLDARSSFDESGHTDAALRDKAVLFRALTNVAIGVAAASAAAGIVLVATAPRAPKGASGGRHEVRIGPSGLAYEASF
jgi:tetratricopeptide (TPR) repeat protein